MKLDLIALFNSDFNATPDDTAWRAGVTLWGKAWHQVPAGSLPNDDPTLCNLSGMGRDLRTWRRIKGVAMHGFVECADGRLYHPFVCAMAQDAAAERRRFEGRKERDRLRKRDGDRVGIPPSTAPPSDGIPSEKGGPSSGIPRQNAVEGAERERDREKASKQLSQPVNGSHAPAEVDDPLRTGMADLINVDGHPTIDQWPVDGTFERCCREAKINLAASRATWQPVIEWLRAGYIPQEIAWLIREIASRPGYKPPRTLAYFASAVREQCKPGYRSDGFTPWHD